MLFRAPRDLERAAHAATRETVGPGAYSNEKSFDTIQNTRINAWKYRSNAPFGSTSTRNCGAVVCDDADRAPGPGYYETELSDVEKRDPYKMLHNQLQKAEGIGTHCFTSRVRRFAPLRSKQMEDVDRLGPGEYDTTWALRKAKCMALIGPSKAQNSQVSETIQLNGREKRGHHTHRVFKFQTTPSIPIPSRSFGYEEGANGCLQPHIPPEIKGEKSQVNGVPGPGAYETTALDVALSKKGAFNLMKRAPPRFRERALNSSEFPPPTFIKPGILSKNRNVNNAPTTPGPGSYSPDIVKSEVREMMERLQGMSSFNTRVKRELVPLSLTKDVELYGAKSCFDRCAKSERMDKTFHAFGSSIRDTDGTEPTKSHELGGLADEKTSYQNSTVPGPGAYDVCLGMGRLKSKGKPVHFNSTAARLSTNSVIDKQSLPGPGEYNTLEMHTIMANTTPQRHSVGAFNTTSARFTHRSFSFSSDTESVGPGAYEIPVSGSLHQNPADVRRKDLRNAYFKSRTTRFGSVSKHSENDTVPPVGTYNIESCGGTHPSKGIAFSRSPRPVGNSHSISLTEWIHAQEPGPGSYDPQLDPVRPRRMIPAVLHRTSKRFSDGNIASTKSEHSQPRFPGPGSYNVARNLMKKTFNVTFV